MFEEDDIEDLGGPEDDCPQTTAEVVGNFILDATVYVKSGIANWIQQRRDYLRKQRAEQFLLDNFWEADKPITEQIFSWPEMHAAINEHVDETKCIEIAQQIQFTPEVAALPLDTMFEVIEAKQPGARQQVLNAYIRKLTGLDQPE